MLISIIIWKKIVLRYLRKTYVNIPKSLKYEITQKPNLNMTAKNIFKPRVIMLILSNSLR